MELHNNACELHFSKQFMLLARMFHLLFHLIAEVLI